MDRPPEFFGGLPDQDAADLASLASRIVLPAGSSLFTLGSEATHVYAVERGRIDLTLPIEIAGALQDVLVEERTVGQVLGWSALIPPHRFTLKATAPLETELLAFPREPLLAFLGANPRVGYQVMRSVGVVLGHRLQVLQAMWVREMRRVIEHRYA